MICALYKYSTINYRPNGIFQYQKCAPCLSKDDKRCPLIMITILGGGGGDSFGASATWQPSDLNIRF